MDKLEELKLIEKEILEEQENLKRKQELKNTIKQNYINELNKEWKMKSVFIQSENKYGIVKDANDFNSLRVNIVQINHNHKLVLRCEIYNLEKIEIVSDEKIKEYLFNKVLELYLMN